MVLNLKPEVYRRFGIGLWVALVAFIVIAVACFFTVNSFEGGQHAIIRNFGTISAGGIAIVVIIMIIRSGTGISEGKNGR